MSFLERMGSTRQSGLTGSLQLEEVIVSHRDVGQYACMLVFIDYSIDELIL